MNKKTYPNPTTPHPLMRRPQAISFGEKGQIQDPRFKIQDPRFKFNSLIEFSYGVPPRDLADIFKRSHRSHRYTQIVKSGRFI